MAEENVSSPAVAVAAATYVFVSMARVSASTKLCSCAQIFRGGYSEEACAIGGAFPLVLPCALVGAQMRGLHLPGVRTSTREAPFDGLNAIAIIIPHTSLSYSARVRGRNS